MLLNRQQRSLRIGIMCHASFGGSARVASELAAALAARGHAIHLFTLGHLAWGDIPKVRLHEIPRAHISHAAHLHTDWHSGERRRFLDHVLHTAKQERLDVLHFHYALPFALIAAEVKMRLGPAAPLLVGTLHGTDVTKGGRDAGQRARLARALSRMDSLTTVSLAYACLAARQFNLDSYPEVISNFVDLERFRPNLVLQEQNGNGRTASVRPKIVHISNFRPVKDPLSMAEIFARIREKLDVELILVGDGPQMGQVREFFCRKGVGGNVRYLGLQRNVAPLLAQANLLLMTSLEESFCLAALEAMACGVPVLATRVGGLPEVVVHGKTGYLYPVHAYAEAANHAVDLLTNPEKHQVMRDAALAQARRFNQHYVVPTYEALYQQLVSARVYPVITARATTQLSYVMV